MSSQPPPIVITPTFNPNNFVGESTQETFDINDARYIRLTTDQSVGGVKNFTTTPQINGVNIKTYQSGTVSYAFTIGAGLIGGPTTVSFSPAFSSAPNVVCTILGTTANNCSRLVVSVQSVSTTDFSYNISNFGASTASSIQVCWVATL